jgi:hypothetical protein
MFILRHIGAQVKLACLPGKDNLGKRRDRSRGEERRQASRCLTHRKPDEIMESSSTEEVQDASLFY